MRSAFDPIAPHEKLLRIKVVCFRKWSFSLTTHLLREAHISPPVFPRGFRFTKGNRPNCKLRGRKYLRLLAIVRPFRRLSCRDSIGFLGVWQLDWDGQTKVSPPILVEGLSLGKPCFASCRDGNFRCSHHLVSRFFPTKNHCKTCPTLNLQAFKHLQAKQHGGSYAHSRVVNTKSLHGFQENHLRQKTSTDWIWSYFTSPPLIEKIRDDCCDDVTTPLLKYPFFPRTPSLIPSKRHENSKTRHSPLPGASKSTSMYCHIETWTGWFFVTLLCPKPWSSQVKPLISGHVT